MLTLAVLYSLLLAKARDEAVNYIVNELVLRLSSVQEKQMGLQAENKASYRKWN